ncbi:TRAP transporter small permease subunit [Tropicimonas sediminicola]|uniref:TRAP transporter small permease protein n=1 Tax=Tropicimonas sediminicola TaxID=1031541 RepID=A0A239CY71_9RHOB|nr:TRAP transporter small permease subunit [Tropicimonas sediminicola]SNS24889.1 TRAP-type mannitol/chloroaromatic compound transport system, small permease component [Tropicimonas sediminicola]
MNLLIQSAATLHEVTRRVCQLLLGMIFIGQLAVVILRYVFGIGFIELQDAVAYSFATLVVLGLPVAQALDSHVRVDVFRSGQSPRGQLWFDRFGIVVFLIPVFALTIWWVWPDVAYSWSIREASAETGGLPGLYLVKSMLPLACALMILQGLAELARSLGSHAHD